MRADAQKNYDHVLAIARVAIDEQGVNASLRDVARRAGVGLGTLYRHFPTREALLEALLRNSFDGLNEKAKLLEMSALPAEALISWLRDVVDAAHRPRGVVASMAAAIADEESALHTSCVTMRAAGARLLARAQEAGVARNDLQGSDLFALISALAWVYDQPSLAPRAEHIFRFISGAVLLS